MKIDGDTKGTTVTNKRGEWVWVTKDPINAGSSEITAEARRELQLARSVGRKFSLSTYLSPRRQG